MEGIFEGTLKFFPILKRYAYSKWLPFRGQKSRSIKFTPNRIFPALHVRFIYVFKIEKFIGEIPAEVHIFGPERYWE